MKVLLRVLVAITLINLGYFALTESGLIPYFNKVVNENDGWKKVGEDTYKKEVRISTYWTEVAILNNPDGEEIKIYRGHIKKKALDNMDFIGLVRVEVKGQKLRDWDGSEVGLKEKMHGKLKNIAKKNGGNVVAVQDEGTSFQNTIERWNF